MTAHRGRGRRTIAVLLVAASVLAACSGDDEADDPGEPTTTIGERADTGEPTIVTPGATGSAAVPVLGLRLSEGAAIDEPAAALPVVDGTALTQEEVAAIVARLPEWLVPADDQQPFNRPAATLGPPQIGETIETPFPPTPGAGPADPAGGPLEVVRFQPEGDVDIAPFLTVTFNQPMVPLATLDQLAAQDVPVTITPPIEGRWRWIGTRTLRFEVVPGETDRLPAATEFTIEVPAGTESASGARLDDDVTWSFATPAPQVASFVGESDSLTLTPVFVAVFDQRVDADAVLASITVDAGGDTVPFRRATDAEVAADEAASAAVDTALPDRAVAFRADAELPVDTAITVTIGPGTPSAEGPLVSETPAVFRGRTYGALDIVRTDCGYGGPCVPGLPFTIELSNTVDPATVTPDRITVEPAIPGVRVNVYGNVLEIAGATTGSTTYGVTLDAAIADVFGQTLGTDRTAQFEVGPAQPMLQGLQRDWITTDPGAEQPTVSIRTVNHDAVRVLAWAVTPADVDSFRTYLEGSYSGTVPATPAWTQVLDEVIEIDGADDQFVETVIDLSEAFARAGSQLVVRVEPTETYQPNDELYWSNRPTVAWVQTTTIGVAAFVDDDELLVWTNDLMTGEPLGGLPVELLGDGRVATTDADGVARLPLSDSKITGLWANGGDRTAFLPADWYGSWTIQTPADESRWYVFDDRGIYRPGETVQVTGWLRRLSWADDGALQLYDDGLELQYTAYDPQGNQLAAGTTPINAVGGFNLAIDLPAGTNLGAAYVDLQVLGAPADQYVGTQHVFQVQEFRRPEFEVTARHESTGPYYTAQPATVAVDAAYFAGGPLPDAEVDWLVTTATTSYRPPNWDRFTFGIWQPWWFDSRFGDSAADVEFAESCFGCTPETGDAEFEQFAGRTDAGGTHYLRIEFDGPEIDQPSTITAEATVYDVDRQAWASRIDLLVHPASYYVGVRSDRTFVEQGTPIRYDVVVTDVDGAAVAGQPVVVTAGRLEWTYADGAWDEQVTDEQTCTLTSTADPSDGSMQCEFTTAIGGTYRVTAVVTDADGRHNRTETTMWVSGGTGRPVRDVEQQQVTVVPDRETYVPGDTAELLVQAPFAPATGIMTVLHHGIVRTETFETTDGSAVLQIPIDDASVPGLTVQVDMVGTAARTADDGSPVPGAPARPAYATAQIALTVAPVTRALTVTATPAVSELTPGDDTSVTVQVTRPDGSAAAGAEVALIVVDEAVLSLTGYELLDPLDVFYGALWPNLASRYTRSSILLTRSDLLGGASGAASTTIPAGGARADQAAAPAALAEESAADTSGVPYSPQGALGGSDGDDGGAAPIELRDDFEPLAVYAPGQVAGADGTVTVAVPLPDTLTRYRVMAVAVDGADRFGKGESTITARLPLTVRPSAPRFLNYGDVFELPVVLQNQTDAPLVVDVAVQAANLTLGDTTGVPTGKRVTVPANDRIEVRFAVSALDAGTARLRVIAISGDLADATEIELPVYTPATAEAFATYGTIDESGGVVGQPLLAPTGVIPEFGGLEIGTSSTALQALTDAVIYLNEYDYRTPDGYSSRILAISSLRDVLDAFDAEGVPSREALDARVAADIVALVALQNDDGGWSWWNRGLESIPWQTLEAAHALIVAREVGYAVPGDPLDRALAYLGDIEAHIPSEYGADIRTTLRAYAIHVRALAGDRDVTEATEIYRTGGIGLQLDAVAWLWPAIDDAEIRTEIERLFANSATETAGAATFATAYSEDAYVIAASDRRTDGVILDALISESPASDLVPKVVAGLLGNQTKGRWNSAQDNAFILVAMRHYFETFEGVTPEFVARVWLGPTYVAEQAFSGRDTVRAATSVPMTELVAVPEGTNLVLQKDGEGRLYYRLGLRYAPADLTLDARDEGFVVERTYEAVGDPADVQRDADGTWRIRAGATVRVTLTMVADARRTHVALIDPLPAGLEPVNPALAVSQTFAPDARDGVDTVRALDQAWCWCWNWYEHQNLRDDRAEAFTSYLDGGTYEYSYIARATTPGQFVVPPARAEEIYAPEVFGRSASARVIVG